MERLIRIESKYFVAGVIFNENYICIKAAPIIKYMVGWEATKFINYCKSKGWKLYVYRN